MDLAQAMRAAAPGAPAPAIAALASLAPRLPGPAEAAHLIGQCAHESLGFTRVAEALFYTTPARLRAVWPARFRDAAAAMSFLRDPAALANHVYGGRMGNDRPGDGYRYRGRGYLQLTGRATYRLFGARIGIDLETTPERAEEPEIAWAVAIAYFEHRRRDGRTAMGWARAGNVEMVTRIVNGGVHGLEDRRARTLRAASVLGGGTADPVLAPGAEGDAVLRAQHALAALGHSPGALDGDFGPRTAAAVAAFQAARALAPTGVLDAATRALLGV